MESNHHHVACVRCQATNRVPVTLKGRVLFAKVNSDENPMTARRFGIRSIPTLVNLKAGRELTPHSGALQTGQIVSFAG